MNKKLTVLLIGLATSGLTSFGQDNNPPAPPPADNPKPAETQPAVPPPADPVPAPAPAAPEPATPPPAAPPVEKPAPPAPEQAAPALNTDGATVVAARENETAKPADTKPADAAGGEKKDDTVPLIVIDDVPLTDAIRNLARQSKSRLHRFPNQLPPRRCRKPRW